MTREKKLYLKVLVQAKYGTRFTLDCLLVVRVLVKVAIKPRERLREPVMMQCRHFIVVMRLRFDSGSKSKEDIVEDSEK